ncbi:QueT transporter family protein [Paenibacillus wenxiniae]|uniref:QueT transporter family protein n=1 Tax=Paenibacillus wenxiniae TaxID=1636843 RepID=A0ABW4RKV2_9BACL
MTFSRYFFNRGIWWYALRQGGWLGVLYGLMMLCLLPLGLINEEQYVEYRGPLVMHHLFQIHGELQSIIIAAFPALVAVFLTRYMQERKLSDLLHGLPLQRHQLLSTILGIGSIIILLPTWLIALIISFMRPGLVRVSFSQMQLIEWAVSTSVLTMLVFVFTVVVGICVGQSILQLVLSVGILVLPALLGMVMQNHLKMFLYGYFTSDPSMLMSSVWSPIYRIGQLSYNALQAKEGWIYTVLTVLLIGLAYGLYRARPAESSSEGVVFRYFNPFFRILMMLVVSLFVGVISTNLVVDDPLMAIVGYVVGALVGGIVADMIIRKTWQVVDRQLLRMLGGYGVIIALILWLPVAGINGYAARIPAIANIQAVYMGGDLSSDLYNRTYASNGMQIGETLNSNALSDSPQYMDAILNLHRQIVTERPNSEYRKQYNPWANNNQQVQIAYKLKDGSIMKRNYFIPMDRYEAYLLPIVSQSPYKNTYYHLDQLATYKGVIRINNPDTNWTTSPKTISDPKDVEVLKQLVIEELGKVPDPWNQYSSGAVIQVMIDIPLAGSDVYTQKLYTVSANEPDIQNWLQKKNLLSMTTRAQDLKAIQLLPRSEGEHHPDNTVPYQKLNKNAIVITSPDQMKRIIANSQVYSGRYMNQQEKNGYKVQLLFKNGLIGYRDLTSAQMTPELYSMISR